MDIEVSEIAIEHLMNPKNYGNICCADGIGMGFDKKTGEFAIIYMQLEDDIIKDIKFNTNGCADTVVAGSLFTEIVKGANLEYAIKASQKLKQQLKQAPPKQQACSLLVLKGFEAALIHKDKKDKGIKVDEFEKLELEYSCEAWQQN